MASVHELTPSIGNSATRTIIISVMVVVVFNAVFLLNQVIKLDRNPIEEELEILSTFISGIVFPEQSFKDTIFDAQIAYEKNNDNGGGQR